MNLRTVSLIVFAAVLAGCATTNGAGWSGDGAVELDFATAACKSDVEHLPKGKMREEAFEECMASNGWKKS